ncbi:polysaccharide pyruvyl transferase family protein [Arthrobacter citreus]|uniref:Polysaccharide pyruvyl transferase family protein n=1 Tax=Arthrobacter citreus TaxID=1670 RepID=A0ABZ2ZUX3_9MICC
MSKVLILHAYSAKNRGDGLLVEEALELIRESLGQDAAITMCASHPKSFDHLTGLKVVDSGFRRRGYDSDYLRTLRDIMNFDLVVGVGGGYLRAGYPLELIKTALIHGPQLVAAAFRGKSVVYLPQSIGPLRYGTRAIANKALHRLETVMLRDDKSLAELHGVGIVRVPDVAALTVTGPDWQKTPNPTPVLSVREVRGKLPAPVIELAELVKFFDGYVQSSTSGNDDQGAMNDLNPVRILTSSEFADANQSPRVVIAMRLHGALMALRAGHFVIHLAYERKGFGAFADLGLADFVHNSRSFDSVAVLQQAQALLNDPDARRSYSELIRGTTADRYGSRRGIIDALKNTTDVSSNRKR